MLKHIKSFVNHTPKSLVSKLRRYARHHISNDPVEGTNNMIKTLRRQAYGYRDTRYFFLKVWERSRRHTKCRDYSSPQKCA